MRNYVPAYLALVGASVSVISIPTHCLWCLVELIVASGSARKMAVWW
jgi:hypothetical protein